MIKIEPGYESIAYQYTRAEERAANERQAAIEAWIAKKMVMPMDALAEFGEERAFHAFEIQIVRIFALAKMQIRTAPTLLEDEVLKMRRIILNLVEKAADTRVEEIVQEWREEADFRNMKAGPP